MIPTIIISISTFILIAVSLFVFPKVKIGKITLSTYWIIALLGAILILAFQLAPIDEVLHQLTADNKINPIKILVLFFSMTLLSIFLDEFGLFQFLASLAVKNAKGNQYILFFSLYALVAGLTIFTSNDVVILTFTPFICFFCKRAHINPIPYLIAEFTAANTWSLMFLIGNPTNIFLATTADIDFISYFKVMALPTLGAGIIELIMLFALFHHRLGEKITDVDIEHYVIHDKVTLLVGVFHLLICLVFLVISSYINVEMWLISLICAASLLLYNIVHSIFTKKDWSYVSGAFKKLPYPLIPFFLSMFVIVVALNYQGISLKISNYFVRYNLIWTYGYSSFLSANVINNIPMSILYSNICSNLTGLSYKQAVYASIIGSNIGAFLTPMGALAGIMFTNLLDEHDVKFTFKHFIKYGSVISLPTITTALAILMLTVNL